MTKQKINHIEILIRYSGWVSIERDDCIQYWNGQHLQSLFFDEKYMEIGTSDGKMYKAYIPLSWQEFETQCQSASIVLDKRIKEK